MLQRCRTTSLLIPLVRCDARALVRSDQIPKHPDPGWQNLSEPPQSWFWHPTVRCFRWQGTGCEGWEACVNFGNCEAEQTLSVHISCVHYQTALPRSVNDSVCLRLLLALSLTHTHTTLSLFKPHSKNYFLIFTPSPSSLALSLICFISLYLAFIPASLFPSLSPPYLSLDTDW